MKPELFRFPNCFHTAICSWVSKVIIVWNRVKNAIKSKLAMTYRG